MVNASFNRGFPGSCALPELKRGDTEVSMKEIRDGLFIGDIHSAVRVLSAPDHLGITCMLSLVSSTILSSFCSILCPPVEISGGSGDPPVSCSLEVAKKGSAPLVRMVIPLNDDSQQTILDILQPCFDFIDEGRRQGGAVLVHCIAGVSRSAAIVIAYLMKIEKLPWRTAMESLRLKHEKVCPNPGFLQQLQLFENRDFSLDNSAHCQTKPLFQITGADEEDVPREDETKDHRSCRLNCMLVLGSEHALLHRLLQSLQHHSVVKRSANLLSV
eukprot:c25314_g1_i1 orf=370-1185(+)